MTIGHREQIETLRRRILALSAYAHTLRTSYVVVTATGVDITEEKIAEIRRQIVSLEGRIEALGQSHPQVAASRPGADLET